MTRYDWSRVSRQALENLASALSREQDLGTQTPECDAALKQAREEAQAQPRSKAEVDAEIIAKFREYMTSEASDRDTELWHDLEDLVLEPLAEPVLEHEAVFLRKLQSEGEVTEIRCQAAIAVASPREQLAAPITETPEALQLLLKSVFVHRMTEGVQWHPGLVPTIVQIRQWDPIVFEQVARWVRLEHALAQPIAGLEYPERDPVPLAVQTAVAENERLERELKDKPQKPKRQRQKKASAR